MTLTSRLKEKCWVHTKIAEEPELTHLSNEMVEMMHGFDYRRKTTLKIPMIVLMPVK